jgi:hypothetical protein
MSRTTEDPLSTRCPRCGADVRDPEATSCACCGSWLANARAPLRMSPELGLPPARPMAARAVPAGQGFALVREHAQYELWMQDAPTGLVHALGLGALAAGGLAFALLALLGTFHSRSGSGGPGLFVGVGLALAAFGGWRLARFLQAPRRNRVARVAEERERLVRTRHGWRTKHYATFEFEDGSREEFPVSTGVASELARGDCGVLITRDVFLLAFHRAGRA